MNLFKLFFSATVYSVLFCSALAAISPPKDSIKKNNSDTLKLNYFFEKDLFTNQYSKRFLFIDTLLNNVQNTKLRFSGSNFKKVFSNSGLGNRNLIFCVNPKLGFNDELPTFMAYEFLPESNKYYDVSNAFTDVFYMMGTGREQLFDLLHTQNLAKRWNVALNYRMIFSPGLYLRQKSDNAFLNFSTNYHSKNNKYLVIGNYFFNRIKVQENGGIINDSVFEYDFELSRKLIEVNLFSAQNKIAESGVYIRQFFTPVIKIKRDSLSDSLKSENNAIGFGRFYHSFLYKNQYRVYKDEDPTSGFYPNVFLDTALTLDSSHVQKLENAFGWSNLKQSATKTDQNIVFDIYGKHQLAKVYQQISDTTFNSLIAGLEVRIKSVFGFGIISGASRTFSGYGSDNNIASLYIDRSISRDSNADPFKISGTYLSSSVKPDWFSMHYYSNHFMWDYNFLDIKTKVLKAEIKNSRYGLGLSYTDVLGFVYYDKYARPKQALQNVEILQLNAFANLKSGEWHLDQIVNYQKAFGPEIIKLPDLASFHNLYFEHLAFNKALKFQIGISATFLMGDYIMAYMPATRQFYLQDNRDAKPYAFMDFYMNAQIKRAYLFVKLEHFNAGLMGRSYFLTEHYPGNDRLFRFGVSWKFFD